MNEPRRKRNIPLTIAGVMLCLTLLSTWLVGGIYAKFVTSDSASDSARVAKFVFDVGSIMNLDVSDMMPGNTRFVEFKVKNSRGGSVSEVSETYYLTIAVNGSMPLILTLTDVTNGGNNQVSTVTRAFTSPNAATSDTKPSNVTLQAANLAQGRDYKLTVEWPEKDSNGDLWNAELASGASVASVTLKIDGVQVD